MKTTKNTPPKVQQLNELQAAWMAIDATTATPAEINAICRRMEAYPKAYATISADTKSANVIIDGAQQWAHNRPTQAAIDYLKRLAYPGTRTDVAWQGSAGQWVGLE